MEARLMGAHSFKRGLPLVENGGYAQSRYQALPVSCSWKGIEMEYVAFLLFIYSSWAFIRIGQLHRYCDNELAELWESFTKFIEENE